MSDTEVLIGDRVRYESGVGTVRGEVVKIMQDKIAPGDSFDWIYVQYHNELSPSKSSIARIPSTAFESIGFKVIFRDIEVQIAHAKKSVS